MIKYLTSQFKKSQLLKDSFWSLLGNVVGRGLALLAGILVARFLGKELFGEYGIIRNTILTIGTFSTFGLGYTATKFVAELKISSPGKIPAFIQIANKVTLAFSGCMAVFLFAFADFVAEEWLGTTHLGLPLRILSILIVFNAITNTQIGVLSGFGRFKELAKINSFIGFLTFIFSAVLTYFFALTGALLALLIVQITNCILNYSLVRKETHGYNTPESADKTLLKNIFDFSTPIAMQEAVYSATQWMASLLLVRLATFGDLGMYTAAMQWNAIILFIPGILRNVVLSHLSGHTTDSEAHEKVLNQTVLINFFTSLVPCVFVFFLSDAIASSYGNSFEGLGSLISLACFATIFISISNVYAQAYMSKGLNWHMFVIRLVRDLGMVVLAFLLISSSQINLNGAFILVLSLIVVHALFLLLIVAVYKIRVR